MGLPYVVVHVDGADNVLADYISRFKRPLQPIKSKAKLCVTEMDLPSTHVNSDAGTARSGTEQRDPTQTLSRKQIKSLRQRRQASNIYIRA